MSSLNKIILIGNVGKDPESRSLQDGREVVTFPLATSESWKDKSSGERKERTQWHNIVIFSQPLVKIAQGFIRKGSKLYIEGSINTRKWTDQSNVERQTTEVVIQPYGGIIKMLDSRNNQNNQSENSLSKEPAYIDDKQKNDFEIEELDDELPF